MKKLLIQILLATTVILSCGKSNDHDSTAITKENLMGDYKITSFVATVGGVPTPDPRSNCEKDNIFRLMANNVLMVVDAGVVCNPPTDATGTWDLQGNMLTLGGQISGTIKSFNGKDLVVENTGTQQGVSYVLTVTFTKQ